MFITGRWGLASKFIQYASLCFVLMLFSAPVGLHAQGNLHIITSALPSATIGGSYSISLTASGGSPPYRWALYKDSILPTGLRLSSSGEISGTPSAAGTFTFEIEVSDNR